MSFNHYLAKCFPNLAKSYIDHKKYSSYKARKKYTPDRYSQLIMDEWTKRGFEPFDLKNPQTYRQKIQWAEIYEKNPLKTTLTDKVAVRDWVAEKIGEEYLIPLLGVYENAEDIDYNKLPKSFAIKMNHSSGMNIIVKDKSNINIKKINAQLTKWLNIDYAFYGTFQPHYLGIKPKIMIEKYTADKNDETRDYKFLCFNGEVNFCWVDLARFGNHKRNIYDLDWKLQPWRQELDNYTGEVEKPQSFDKMVELSKILCQGFSHVRVDLYNVDGKIYFGEMTFSNGGGHDRILPEKYDKIIGDMWEIDNNNNK